MKNARVKTLLKVVFGGLAAYAAYGLFVADGGIRAWAAALTSVYLFLEAFVSLGDWSEQGEQNPK